MIRSDGSLGGYSGKGGVKTKKLLLKKEGSNDLELLFDGRFVRLPKIGSLFSGFTR